MDHTDNGIFILAKGILWFFEEAKIKRFFSSLADALPGAELICEASSKLGASLVNDSLKSVDMAHRSGVGVEGRTRHYPMG